MKSISTALGASYSVESLLGKGGQGTVVRLKSQQGLAAKILHMGSEREREALKNRIAFVRSLPLGDLPVAMPVDSLAPPLVGYTMQLLRDMEPATALLRPPKDSGMSLPEWYASRGGLMRRLRLMAKSCDARPVWRRIQPFFEVLAENRLEPWRQHPWPWYAVDACIAAVCLVLDPRKLAQQRLLF